MENPQPIQWIGLTRMMVLSLFILGFTAISSAQDLENLDYLIDKEKPFNIRGNLFANHIFSNNTRVGAARSSFNIGGNVALKLYGVSVPIKFAFRNSNLSLENSLNLSRFGLSPTYKGVTVHGGYRSMSLHKFLYAGQTFLGGGVEFKTSKFEVKILKGKLQNFITAIAVDQVDEGTLESYDRDILAGNIGMRAKSIDVVATLMKIKDAPDSFVLPDSVRRLNPAKENLGLGLEANFRIGRYLNLENQVAISGFTNDVRVGDQLVDPQLVSDLESFITVNNSSRYAMALESRLMAKVKNVNLGLNYKRVEPEYTSLGLYQMNSDYQDIAVTVGLRLLQSRLTTNVRYGIRNNNISNTRTSTDTRNILSVSANARITESLSLQGSYSDHASERTAGIIELGDSLQYVQASKTLNLSPSYNFMIKDFQQRINLSFLNQEYNSITNTDVDNSTRLNSINARYTFSVKETGLSFNLGAKYNKNEGRSGETILQTVNFGARKRFKDKGMNLKANISLGDRTKEGESLGSVFTAKMGYDLNFKKKHQLGITAQYNKRPLVNGQLLEDTRIYTTYRYTLN